MRTRNLTISLPPAQLRKMENIDINEYIRRIAPAPAALQAIRDDARLKGSNKVTMAQINREVAAVRRQHDKKKTGKRQPGRRKSFGRYFQFGH